MNSKHINKKILYIVDVILFVLGIVADRLSKEYAVLKLKNHPSISVFSNILELRYLENSGAAFGLLQNQKNFFILVAFVVVTASVYLIIKSPDRSKYILFNICLSLIAAGAVGNTIDRLIYGYVVDFIYFYIINFPIFNVADIFVTIASVILVIELLFVFKEDDMNFISFNEKRIRDIK